MFNPDTFMNTSMEGALSTEYPEFPSYEGPAVIQSVEANAVPATDGSGMLPVLNITWAIDDEHVKEVTGIANPTVRQSFWLALTDDGRLDQDKGKNVSLGLLRTALGQNTGAAWSPRMLEGQVARISVEAKPSKKNPEKSFPQVTGFAKI